MKNLGFVESMVNYDAPQVKVIEVEVEKGFAVSSNVEDPDYGGSI